MVSVFRGHNFVLSQHIFIDGVDINFFTGSLLIMDMNIYNIVRFGARIISSPSRHLRWIAELVY